MLQHCFGIKHKDSEGWYGLPGIPHNNDTRCAYCATKLNDMNIETEFMTGNHYCNCDSAKDMRLSSLTYNNMEFQVWDITKTFPLIVTPMFEKERLDGTFVLEIPNNLEYCVKIIPHLAPDQYYSFAMQVGDKKIKIENGKDLYYSTETSVDGFETGKYSTFKYSYFDDMQVKTGRVPRELMDEMGKTNTIYIHVKLHTRVQKSKVYSSHNIWQQRNELINCNFCGKSYNRNMVHGACARRNGFGKSSFGSYNSRNNINTLGSLEHDGGYRGMHEADSGSEESNEFSLFSTSTTTTVLPRLKSKSLDIGKGVTSDSASKYNNSVALSYTHDTFPVIKEFDVVIKLLCIDEINKIKNSQVPVITMPNENFITHEANIIRENNLVAQDEIKETKEFRETNNLAVQLVRQPEYNEQDLKNYLDGLTDTYVISRKKVIINEIKVENNKADTKKDDDICISPVELPRDRVELDDFSFGDSDDDEFPYHTTTV
jgi:hypothetical protein